MIFGLNMTDIYCGSLHDDYTELAVHCILPFKFKLPDRVHTSTLLMVTMMMSELCVKSYEVLVPTPNMVVICSEDCVTTSTLETTNYH